MKDTTATLPDTGLILDNSDLWSIHPGYDLSRHTVVSDAVNDRDLHHPGTVLASVVAEKFTGCPNTRVRMDLSVGPADMQVCMSPEKAREKMQVFMDRLEQHYGKRPVIYTAPDFYKDNLRGHFLDYPFWLRSVAAHPSKVYPGRKWVFWQYSGSGLSQGVNGKIDLNVFYGSVSDWQNWVSGKKSWERVAGLR